MSNGMNDIDRLLFNSSKADLLEQIAARLKDAEKIIVILAKEENGRFHANTLMLGISQTHEALGILELVKHDIIEDNE